VIGQPRAKERGSPRRATSRVGLRPSRSALEVFQVPMPFHSKVRAVRRAVGRFKVEIARKRKFILRRALCATLCLNSKWSGIGSQDSQASQGSEGLREAGAL
jgi:hypothetical protein